MSPPSARNLVPNPPSVTAHEYPKEIQLTSQLGISQLQTLDLLHAHNDDVAVAPASPEKDGLKVSRITEWLGLPEPDARTLLKVKSVDAAAAVEAYNVGSKVNECTLRLPLNELQALRLLCSNKGNVATTLAA